MSTPNADAFSRFFEAVHGYPPFPWQSRLAARVIVEGRWPGLLDLPTGTGKTSAIDVALFALARRPDVFPRRIVLVVDRRVVVDQAAEHAREIQKALNEAGNGPARAVAVALRQLFGGEDHEPPFTVSVLRGGMPSDEAWADSPDRPVVALSTVDQVGSRLLFRGYGVSPRMAPVHAGLLGNDTLFLLDEVQLSTAFAETLRALHRRWRPWHARKRGAALPDRWAAVRMSATPIGEDLGDEPSFHLEADDREHPVLARRLGARKLASVEMVRVSNEEADRSQQLAEAFAKAARTQVSGGAVAAAVVVNRVDTARRIHRILHDDAKRLFDVVLLTGRMRPLDRIEALGNAANPSTLLGRIVAGRTRSEGTRPLIVVATQCIEAGADFDFDALVTECASLDALRQRFGRIDRRGELGKTQSTILVRHDHVGEEADDPIYGKALAATWSWLQAKVHESGSELIDLGIAGFPAFPEDSEEQASLCSAVVRAPVLLPAHIDAWAQTNPRPEPDPDVALWLHGPSRDLPDVRLVWRADLDEQLLNDRAGDDSLRPRAGGRDHTVPPDEERRRKTLARKLLPQLVVCPPSSLESISVPLPAARAWLAHQAAEPFGDIEGSREIDGDAPPQRQAGGSISRLCVRLSRDGAEIIEREDMRPGDTLVVPSSYGGIAHRSWDPEARDFVPDLGDWAQLVHRGRPVLRLVPEVLAGAAARPVQDGEATTLPVALAWCSSRQARAVPSASTTDDPDLDPRAAIKAWIDSVRDAAGSKLQAVLRAIVPAGARARYRHVEIAGGRFALVGRRRVDPKAFLALPEDVAGEVLTEDDDSSSFTGEELTLRAHLRDVKEQARRFAVHLGLGEELASDLALAAGLHDVGKADRRFQQMLAGGNEVRLALQREPLAKSSGEARDIASRNRARERAGYPRGYRHELLSVAMLEGTPGVLGAANDRDLVLHLVGSHHGWCRPFARAVDHGPHLDVEFDGDGLLLRADAAHGLARLDSGIADRFFDLVDRYGWWGLAWLEAIVRLADHRASEAARDDIVEQAPGSQRMAQAESHTAEAEQVRQGHMR